MFNTLIVNSAHQSIKPAINKFLNSLNNLKFKDCKKEIEDINRDFIFARKNYCEDQEDILNEFFIFDRYVELLSLYLDLWQKIINGNFSSSWISLQNSLDLLRIIKKFIDQEAYMEIYFYEFQLIELEKVYPYKIFFSIGAVAENIECGICGKDIDSPDCPHIKGELYKGKMAYGICRNITELNHISLVSNPADKRCVVAYDDNGEQFKLVRYLAELISDEKLVISDFGELRFSKKKIKNPEYRKLGRNAICYCESGKKFKKCCILKEYVERDHLDILPIPEEIKKYHQAIINK